MELWIRSQDKEKLIKVDYLRIIENEEDKEFPFYINAGYDFMAAYKTKERALEILDEIQNKIKPQSIYKEYHNEIKDGKNKLEFELEMTPKESTIEFIEPHTIIYEMPKD